MASHSTDLGQVQSAVVDAVAPLSAVVLPAASLGTQLLAAAPCGTAVAHVAVLAAGTPARPHIINTILSATSQQTVISLILSDHTVCQGLKGVINIKVIAAGVSHPPNTIALTAHY